MKINHQLLTVAVSLVPLVAATSEVQYQQLIEVAEFSKVAYCMNDAEFGVGTFATECSSDIFCTENGGIEIVASIRPDISEREYSGTAFVAADHQNQTLIVAFRGSESLADWITDVIFVECQYAPYFSSGFSANDLNKQTSNKATNDTIKENGDTGSCEDCMVHCGLYAAYVTFMDDVLEASTPYLKQGYNLVVTGHSLGGGYAALAGLDFQLRGYNPMVVTLAALKQGNQAYNKYIDAVFGTDDRLRDCSAPTTSSLVSHRGRTMLTPVSNSS